MSAQNVLKFIKEKEAEFVDLRFTDPRGKLQHLTMKVYFLMGHLSLVGKQLMSQT